MNKQLVLLLCVVGVLCGPVNVMGETKHCGPNKIPFDPDTEGCCHLPLPLPDGTWKKTPYPQNEPDPCSKVSSGRAQGAVICYNGNMIKCTYPANYPNTWKEPYASKATADAIQACLDQHEQYHLDNHIMICKKCTGPAEHPSKQKEKEQECEAFEDSLRCARKVAWDRKGGTQYYNAIRRELNRRGCPGW